MTTKYKSSNTSVYNISYHIVWIPKYRKSLLIGNVEKRLKKLLLSKAKSLGVILENHEVMPDHVHLFIRCNPSTTPNVLIKKLKGYTSFVLRKEFPHLKKYKSLWTRNYFIESIGYISEKVIKKYMDNQKLA